MSYWDNMELVDVTQADRDAAADWFDMINGDGTPAPHTFTVTLRAAILDAHGLVQAFARHRIAHQPQMRIDPLRVEEIGREKTMRLPWFMHSHGAEGNTMVGVLPTPVGSFVRSYSDGRMDAVWYPMSSAFPGGGSRITERLASVDATDEGERDLEDAVMDYMHSHPVLALTQAFDTPGGAPLAWERSASGAFGTIETEHGLLFQIHHGGKVTLEFLATTSKSGRETLGTFADTCDEGTLVKRIDARARRRLALAEAGRQPARKPL